MYTNVWISTQIYYIHIMHKAEQLNAIHTCACCQTIHQSGCSGICIKFSLNYRSSQWKWTKWDCVAFPISRKKNNINPGFKNQRTFTWHGIATMYLNFQTLNKNTTSWCFQPIWKILVKMFIPPNRVEKSKNIWVATTWKTPGIPTASKT